MNKTCFRLIFILSGIILISSVFLLYEKDPIQKQILSTLNDYFYRKNFSSPYENIVLLSCSSDSYNSVYCYYLPYVALAWRRIGFEPIVFLVGTEEKFQRMPLVNLLKNDLKITYHFFPTDSSRSISTSQLIRLFGGFLTYNITTKKDFFIIISDVDLIPISRHRFEIRTNNSNSILAVNAFCCPSEKFSFENYHNIHYYPISYIGMTKDQWKKLFLPLNHCQIPKNLTIDFINCCLQERMNVTIPKNVIKAKQDWDLDQRFLSILIARAQSLYLTQVDKRPLGHRLDPNKNFLFSEFRSILDYDDVHLPNKNEELTFTNRTLDVFRQGFANLFPSETIQLLSRYHYQTAAFFRRSKTTKSIEYKDQMN